ncbi:hypothetical protein J5N97_007847 [Dioscorea zingiberensis]|uniref:RING-type E3 ubiquitin transferase n=1 Tax=Dioscorea zingiberensis TaxID=325984 RepID=A0A9D5HV98_9LILI|nr:hypothetical protein J5N97_007847 [Dioscorea zingiberensis]
MEGPGSIFQTSLEELFAEITPVYSLTPGETNMPSVNVAGGGSAVMDVQQSYGPLSDEIQGGNAETIVELGDGDDAVGGSRKRKTTEQELGQSSESEANSSETNNSSPPPAPVSDDDASFIIIFDSSNDALDVNLSEEHQNQRRRITTENLASDSYPSVHVAGSSETAVANSGIRIGHAHQGDDVISVTSNQTLEEVPVVSNAANAVNANLNSEPRLAVASVLRQSLHPSLSPEAFSASIEDLIYSIPAEDLQDATREITFYINQETNQIFENSENFPGNNIVHLTEGSPNLNVANAINMDAIPEAGRVAGIHPSSEPNGNTSSLTRHQLQLLKLIQRYSPNVLSQSGSSLVNSQSRGPSVNSQSRGPSVNSQSVNSQSRGPSVNSQSRGLPVNSQPGGPVGFFPPVYSGPSNSIRIGHQSGARTPVNNQQPFFDAIGLVERISDDENDLPPFLYSPWYGSGRGALGIAERLQFRYGEDFVRRIGLTAESGRFYDRHRDLRLDVDNMSYEELLALEERIGVVPTGLNEEAKSKCMKLWKFTSAELKIPEEVEPCCICQEEYEDGVEVATMNCGHKYHSGCIKKWLGGKNFCPICRESAKAG